MIFRRYGVTLSDNWRTPMRLFWTLNGARKFYEAHQTYANVFKWERGEWSWLFGARDQSR